MILILTGPPAAGKTTIGPLLAKTLDRAAVIDVDQVRVMFVQPHIAPWKNAAGLAQLRLGAENACALALNFARAGCDVVLLDVLIDETAAIYHQHLAAHAHQIVLLLPTLPTVLARNQSRGQWLTDDEVAHLYQWQENFTQFDERIDNTDLAVDQVVIHLRTRYFSQQRN